MLLISTNYRDVVLVTHQFNGAIKVVIFENSLPLLERRKKVEIDEYPDGTVVLKPAEIISKFEMDLLKSKTFQDRLKAFDLWEAKHPFSLSLP